MAEVQMQQCMLEHGVTSHELKPCQHMTHVVMPEETGNLMNFCARVVLPDGHYFKMKSKEPT